MNPNKGIIEKSGRIIAKGELVDTDAYQILDSLKAEYQSQVWTNQIIFGFWLGMVCL